MSIYYVLCNLENYEINLIFSKNMFYFNIRNNSQTYRCRDQTCMAVLVNTFLHCDNAGSGYGQLNHVMSLLQKAFTYRIHVCICTSVWNAFCSFALTRIKICDPYISILLNLQIDKLNSTIVIIVQRKPISF